MKFHHEGVSLESQHLYRKARELLACGRPKNALVCLKQAMILSPGFCRGLLEQGECFDLLGCYEKALESYSRAITGNPFLGEAWAGKGAVLNKLGRNKEADHCMNRARECRLCGKCGKIPETKIKSV